MGSPENLFPGMLRGHMSAMKPRRNRPPVGYLHASTADGSVFLPLARTGSRWQPASRPVCPPFPLALADPLPPLRHSRTSTLAHSSTLPLNHYHTEQNRGLPQRKGRCGAAQHGGTRCHRRCKAVRVCDGKPVLTVAGTKRRKPAWNGRFATGNARPPARYRAEWRPPAIGTVPMGTRPVVADCGDLYRKCQPALRAGYRQCVPLGVTTAAAATAAAAAVLTVKFVRQCLK